MRYSRPDRHASRPIGFNATPMVDVIFMLTIFFMLVSTFSSKENIPMELPSPVASQAKTVEVPDRVVLNCSLADDDGDAGGGVLYQVGANPPASLDVLAKQLAAMKRQSPNLQVVVRADKRLMYRDVRAAMRVVALNKIQMLNVAAHTGEGE